MLTECHNRVCQPCLRALFAPSLLPCSALVLWPARWVQDSVPWAHVTFLLPNSIKSRLRNDTKPALPPLRSGEVQRTCG